MTHAHRYRRGSVYVLVLAAGVTLTAVGIGSLAVISAQRRGEAIVGESGRARAAARAGLEVGAHILAADPGGTGWRVSAPTKLYKGDVEANTSYVLTLRDEDGNLADDATDPITLVAEGTRLGAEQRLSISASPIVELLPCMGSCIWAHGSVLFDRSTVRANAVIGSNSTMTASSAFVYADVAAKSFSGSAFSGSRRTISSSITMPSASVFTTWAARATPIPYASISGGNLEKCILGPGVNRFGATNVDGIYVVDCRGSKIEVMEMRLYGTLILLNVGAGSRIDRTTFLESPSSDRPTLLVMGDFNIEFDGDDLKESTAGCNLNPGGAPFLGVADSDTLDVYPSMMRGVVYVSGNVILDGATTIDGVLLVGGSLTVKANVTAYQRSPSAAMEGFNAVTGWTIDPTSLARVVDP